MLCISFLEQSAELRLTELPVLRVGEVYEKYRALLGETGRLGRTVGREALRTLARCRLIAPAEGKRLRLQDLDQQLTLLPTLRLAIDVERLDQATALLERYIAEPEVDAEDEEDEVESA